MIGFSLTLAVGLVALGQEIPLEGTQPGDLTGELDVSTRCGCHFNYVRDEVNEPGQSYSATAMAQSARDPLFIAALAVAHRDEPRLSPTCLRCHAPRGWLGGRSEPGDGSMLEDDDLDGVSCDLCHRMMEPAGGSTFIGDGQYTISDSVDKRGSRGTPPVSGHQVIRSDYLKSSEACGICHSLFNPLEEAHDPDGNQLPFKYYEQRTYEEWRDSAVSQQRGCIDCHMRRYDGFNCRELNNRYPDVAHHGIVGGNTFVGKAVAFLYPNLGLDEAVDAVEVWVKENLAAASDLEIRSQHNLPETIQSGTDLELTVRLTNKTGHKLPTGYPEGRRVFLQVELDLDDRDPEIVSGFWNRRTGNLEDDPQLRTYETAHGRVGEGRTRHLALANQVLTDTRIPPEGFRPMHEDMVPFGRDYGSGPPYRHYDEHTYSITMPPGITTTVTGTVTVRAFHQTTSGDYVDFLRGELGDTHPAIVDLIRVFAVLGRVPPELMTEVKLPIQVIERTDPPDSGVVIPPADAGVVDSGTTPGDGDGCGCAVATGQRQFDLRWLAFALLFGIIFRRRR